MVQIDLNYFTVFRKNRVLLTLFRPIHLLLRHPVCILVFALVSCEKLIVLDLKNVTPKIVIQANVYDFSGPCTVKISKSVNFDTSNSYPPVTGAKVVVSDNISQSETLTENVAGTYISSRLRGIPGRTYKLSVKIGEDSYQATSSMPNAVGIDSIYFAVSPMSGEKATTIRFNDPPFTNNYYRLVYFINNVQQKPFYIFDDELFQGGTIRYTLQSRGTGINLLKGDIVTVWLESIDRGVFEFFRTSGNEVGQSTSPSNPVSNISNGALGYFNACSVRKISSTVNR
jgi:hypothetical protein